MKNLKEFYYPKTLEEALEILSENEASEMLNIPVAGSTGIVFSKKPTVKALVDINRIGLDYIKKDRGTVKIGAATVVRKIARSEIIKNMAGGVLSKAAGSIGSILIRNSCTIGGNIADLRIWSDSPSALLVLGAKIKINSKEKERIIKAEEFFSQKPSRTLLKTEMVTEIIIPAPPKNAAGSFIKFGRTKVDYTLMDVSSYFEINDERLINVRIAISGVTLFPKRLKELEKFIEGKIFSEKLLKEIEDKGREEIDPLKTYKASKEYRKHLAGVLLKRSVEESYRGKGKEVIGK